MRHGLLTGAKLIFLLVDFLGNVLFQCQLHDLNIKRILQSAALAVTDTFLYPVKRGVGVGGNCCLYISIFARKL